MKKTLKIFVVLLGSLAAVVLLAVVAIKMYFPPQKVKAILIEELTRRLHREVRMGDVSLSPLSGLSISNLQVSEASTFAQGTFLSAKRFSLFVALRPLLEKRIVVNSVTVEEPAVVVIRQADGKTFNFADLMAGTTAQVAQATRENFAVSALPVKGQTAPEMTLSIAQAQVRNGSVRFVDRSPAKSNADITALNLKVENAGLEKPFPFEGDLKAKAAAFTGSVKAKGVLDWAKGSLKLQSATVGSKDFTISAEGVVGDLKAALPSAALDVTIQEFHHPAVKTPIKGTVHVEGTPQEISFKDLKLALGALQLAGHGRVQGLSTPAPQLSAHLETNEVPVQEVLTITGTKLPPDTKLSGNTQVAADVSGTVQTVQVAAKIQGQYLDITKGTVFKKPAGMACDLQIIAKILQGGAFSQVDSLQARIGPVRVAGAGTYKKINAKAADIDFKIKTTPFPLADAAKLSPAAAASQAALKGQGALELALQGHDDTPAADGVLTLQQAGIKTADADVSGLEGKIAFQTPNALADVLHRTLKTSGQLKVGAIQQTYYRGQNAVLQWNVTDVTEDLSRISGTASLTQGPGNLLNAERLASQFTVARLMLQPLTLLERVQSKGLLKNVGLPSLNNIPFTSLKGNYKLRQGLMEIVFFDLAGGDIQLHTQGTAGLAGDQMLDLQQTVSVAPGLIRGTLGQLAQDASGRVGLKFSITGPAANPQVKLQARELAEKAVKSLTDEILKNPNVKDALKGIFR